MKGSNMAKRPGKSAEVGVNFELLKAIASATASGSFMYITRPEGEPLMKAGLILVDTNNLDPNDNSKAAAQITAVGTDWLNKNMNTPAVNEASKPSPYAIIKGAVLPASKRGGGGGGGAPTQYPFADMEVGDTFFVPVSAKHPDPVKTLGSTVSSANLRYAVETGETKIAKRTVRGPGNKAVKDGNGNSVKEDKTVPVYKYERKFSLRAVKAGVTYGAFTPDQDGALIARIS